MASSAVSAADPCCLTCKRIRPATVRPSSSRALSPISSITQKVCCCRKRPCISVDTICAMASTSRPSAIALSASKSCRAARKYQLPSSSNTITAGARFCNVRSGRSMDDTLSASATDSRTINNSATRALRRVLPVQACQAGCSASHNSPPRPMASSCVSRIGRSCSQNPPWIWPCAHSVIARCATTSQIVHGKGWRSPRHSGSVSAAHKANSCQVSAPVW